ncbi:MAG: HigA family addiction module antitoxin [Candidatus Eremiobacteraeota bacterium]|nr:HigA family addiction module antitoxin [Candidatus Eremiobacteraeota bacterium]
MSKSTTKKRPPVHPGEILQKEFMAEHGLNVNKVALALRVPATRIFEIVNGRRSITADTAVRLARYFGTTPEFWLNLQVRFELEMAEDGRAKVDKEVQPISV